ncbi:MAG: murein biosynthesis integral membrane protein MurJ [Bdellovibrio sp.]
MSQEARGLTEDRKKVFKRAFSMASGTLTSRILGLLRDVALGALFDRTVTDSWTAAFRIPNFFRRLLGEGSLAVSFIPVFMEAQGEDPSGVRAKNLVNGFYTLLLIAVATFTLLGTIFTEQIFQLLLSEVYGSSVEKWALTVRMGRIMFGFIFFITTYAYYTGILNSLGSFGIPAVAPALLNICMLAFTFMPVEWFPQVGDGLALGVVVGGLLQAMLLLITLKLRNFLPRLQLKVWSKDVKKVLVNMVPGLVGMGVLQFSTLINLYFASSLPEGTISYIYWADRLLELPLSLVSVSLGAALLPTLSQLAANKEKEKFAETAQESFLMNLFLAWPASLGLFFLARPIVEVLFLRGHFTLADAEATSTVLRIYAVSLVLISCSRVVMPLYYAVKNTWFPAVASFLSLIVNVITAPFLMGKYDLPGLLYSGVSAAFLNMVLLLVGLRYWRISFKWQLLVKPLLKFVVAGFCLALALQVYFLIGPYMPRGLQMLALLLTIIFGIVIYFSSAAFLRCTEFSKIRPLFRL